MASRECVKVANLRKKGYNSLEEWLSNPDHVYIGRNMTFYVKGAEASKWKNPFPVKKYGLDQCLQLYREHLEKSGLIKHIEELRGKTLGCWCQSGEKCHADVLITFLTHCPPFS